MLAGAIARHILDQGWEDKDFIAKNTATADEIAQEDAWRRKKWASTFDDYKAYIEGMDAYTLENAARITGVPAEKIQKATELIAKPNDDGTPRKTLITFEKGATWGINYETIGSLGNLALLTGSVGAEGRGITRAGGHQEGYAGGADYPLDLATDTFEGNKIPNYIDQHMADGQIKIYHVIGANPLGMTNSAQWSRETILGKQAVIPGPQSTDTDEIIANFKQRIDSDGMLLFAQDIFPNLTTRSADLSLPAAGWGEMPGNRWNGERRLRLSERFMDPPGEAKPDWWVIAQVAKKMGFSGYDWKDENEIFTEAAGLPTDYDVTVQRNLLHDESANHTSHEAVVVAAKLAGKTAYDIMSELGTNGVQLPARLDADGKVIGTPRIHTNGKFDSKGGKAMFLNVGWDTAEAIWEQAEAGHRQWRVLVDQRPDRGDLADDVHRPAQTGGLRALAEQHRRDQPGGCEDAGDRQRRSDQPHQRSHRPQQRRWVRYRVADRGGLCLRHRAQGRALDELRLSGPVDEQRGAALHAPGQSGDAVQAVAGETDQDRGNRSGAADQLPAAQHRAQDDLGHDAGPEASRSLRPSSSRTERGPHGRAGPRASAPGRAADTHPDDRCR